MAGDEEVRARAALDEMQLRIAEGPYAVLGLSEYASAEDVRAAFLALTKQYHPARFGRMAGELQRYSNEVFLGIKAAHDQLQRVLGQTGTRPGFGASQFGVDTQRGTNAPQAVRRTGQMPIERQTGPIPRQAPPSFAHGTDRSSPPMNTPPRGLSRPLNTPSQGTQRPATPPINTPPHGMQRPVTPGPGQPRPSAPVNLPDRHTSSDTGDAGGWNSGAATWDDPGERDSGAATRFAANRCATRHPTGTSVDPGHPRADPIGAASERATAPERGPQSADDSPSRRPDPAPTAQFDERTALRECMMLLNERQWTAARVALHTLAAKVPQAKSYRALLCYARGREAHTNGRPDEAQLEYQRALQLDPALDLAGQALAELNRRR